MAQGLEIDVKQLVLSNEPLDAAGVQRLTQAISEDYGLYRPLREAVQELETRGDKTQAGKLRFGVFNYLIGRYSVAESTLGGTDGGMAKFYLAKALAAQGKYAPAVEAFQAAAKAGYPSEWCALGRADADWLDRLITRRLPLERAAEALAAPRPDDIKVVLTLT